MLSLLFVQVTNASGWTPETKSIQSPLRRPFPLYPDHTGCRVLVSPRWPEIYQKSRQLGYPARALSSRSQSGERIDSAWCGHANRTALRPIGRVILCREVGGCAPWKCEVLPSPPGPQSSVLGVSGFFGLKGGWPAAPFPAGAAMRPPPGPAWQRLVTALRP